MLFQWQLKVVVFRKVRTKSTIPKKQNRYEGGMGKPRQQLLAAIGKAWRAG
jgi:hypothetical protein